VTILDPEVFAERVLTIERHLERVANRLPKSSQDFMPTSDASDSVILHLWQSIQIIIDMAISACVHLHIGTPSTYADAFLKLVEAGILDKELGVRLAHASGFRNRIVHAYEKLDMQKIYEIAQNGPKDLRAFLAALNRHLKK
jgi:uncharacterized protein YutE (UPF0331/DUF86 family)